MNFEAIIAQADANLFKELSKLIHRVERILVPRNSLVHSTIGERLDKFLLRVKQGEFFEDVGIFSVEDLAGYDVRSIEPLIRKVAWDTFESEIRLSVGESDTTFTFPANVQDEISTERIVHEEKLQKCASKERVRRLQHRNGLPTLPGKWRKEAYPPRSYGFLSDYCVTTNVKDVAERKALKDQLVTPLNGFFGQAYNYDDHDLTEEWMVTFQDKGSAAASADDVIRTQLESLLEIMCVAVQDRVCTQSGVLEREPLILGKDIKEVPVWGMDSYTRRMVEIVLEDQVPTEQRSPASIKTFIEAKLLPAINAQPPSMAHNMLNAVNSILASPTLGSKEDGDADTCTSTGPTLQYTSLDKLYASAMVVGIHEHSIDVFRIHPKGTGVVCMRPEGIPPHVFVTKYLGEMYPPYRWCERLDIVDQAQQKFELKPTLPDFYNILLERPRQDPKGYGLLYVDASQHANVGSSCSHSCDSNCTSAVVARDGKLVIALTTNRHIGYGEELTMDYYSITTSDVEWRAAICLCGTLSCRGSFLNYATQTDLQQVLNQNCGPLWRYAALLRACSPRPVTAEDEAVLGRHGMRDVALGTNPPAWMKKFAADNLRFLEYERRALPCALMRAKDGEGSSQYTFSAADMDARSVMEQRLQSLVCCFSMVQQVIHRNACHPSLGSGTTASSSTIASTPPASSQPPLAPYLTKDAVARIWQSLQAIPKLMEEHLLSSAQTALEAAIKAQVQSYSNQPTKARKSSPSKSSTGSSNNALKTGSGSLAGDGTASVAVESASSKCNDDQLDSAGSKLTTSPSAAAATANPVDASLPDLSNLERTKRSKEAVVKRIAAAIEEIVLLLSEPPQGLARLRELCLMIRKVLRGIEHTATAKARIGLLADLLVLWAYTQNFSTVQKFAPVESDQMVVNARELGTNIPRSKVFKPFSHRNHANATTSTTNTSGTSTTTAAATNADSDPDLTVINAAITSSTSGGGSGATAATVVGNEEEEEVEEVLLLDTSISSANTTAAAESPPSTSTSSEMIVEEDAGPHTTLADRDAKAPTMTAQLQQEDPITAVSTNPASTYQHILSPDEPVFAGTKKYPPLFTFWQLMGWFNAGTDDKVEAPDLFGCVELPDPAWCFGAAESSYGPKQREALVAQLQDEKLQMMSWPTILKNCFSVPAWSQYSSSSSSSSSTSSSTSSSREAAATLAASATGAPPPLRESSSASKVSGAPPPPLYGSPMLDGALGQVGVVNSVLAHLLEGVVAKSQEKSKKTKKGAAVDASSSDSADDAMERGKKASTAASQVEKMTQFDSILPPEMPTDWVQCELCRQWRRVAWFVDSEKLPDEWVCSMNTWDADNATCSAPQDDYDPDAENTLGFGELDREKMDESSFPVGKMFDLFCTTNKVYYEAIVQKLVYPGSGKKGGKKGKRAGPKTTTTTAAASAAVVDQPGQQQQKGTPKVMFHFIGWGHKFDELVPMDSDRIQPHNLYTNPKTTDPREQEKWQGQKNMYEVKVKDAPAPAPDSTAAATGKGRKKATAGKATGAQAKRRRSGAAGAAGAAGADECAAANAPKKAKVVVPATTIATAALSAKQHLEHEPEHQCSEELLHENADLFDLEVLEGGAVAIEQRAVEAVAVVMDGGEGNEKEEDLAATNAEANAQQLLLPVPVPVVQEGSGIPAEDAVSESSSNYFHAPGEDASIIPTATAASDTGSEQDSLLEGLRRAEARM